MTTNKEPVFDPGKPHSVIHRLKPTPERYNQFGAVFGGDGAFIRFIDGYDPKVHAEKKPPRKRVAKPKTRRASAAKPTAAAKAKAKAEAEAAASKAAEDEAKESLGDELNADG